MERAFGEYIADVKEHKFPAPEHANTMDPQAFRDLVHEIHMLESEIEQDDSVQFH